MTFSAEPLFQIEGRDREYAGWVRDVLASRIRQRFRVQASPSSGVAAGIDRLVVTLCERDGVGEGFRITTDKRHVRIEGTSIGLLFGAGKLLRTLRREAGGMAFEPLNLVESPAMPMRGIFLPILYREGIPFNAYSALCLEEERFDDLEMFLVDLMLWGMNTLGLWYAEAMEFPWENEEGRRIWKKYERILAVARKLRLNISLLTTVNVMPASHAAQHSRLLAPDSPHGLWTKQPVVPSAFCMSRPEARALIRESRRRLFELFAPVAAVDVFPTDPGGCGCPSCTPYAPAYFKLAEEILTDASAYGIKMRGINTWFFHNADARLLAQRAAASPQVTYLSVQSAWEKESTAERIKSIREAAPNHPLVFWPDITMVGTWGLTGSYPCAQSLRRLFGHGVVPHGVMPYSEGRYDDLNKFFFLSLAWNPRQSLAPLIANALDETFNERLPAEVPRAVRLLERHRLPESLALFEAAEARVGSHTRQSMLWGSLKFYARHSALVVKDRPSLIAATERLRAQPSRRRALALRKHIASMRERIQTYAAELPALAAQVNNLDRPHKLGCGTQPMTPEYIETILCIPEAEKAAARCLENADATCYAKPKS